MIRVLVIDDSPFMRKAIVRILSSAPDVEVVGAAGSGTEAFEAIPRLRPDVITLDVIMPGADGLTVLERIMDETPVPTVMLSSVTTENADYTLAALEAGAVDFVAKPTGLTNMEMPRIAGELLSKVRTAAGVHVDTLRAKSAQEAGIPEAPSSEGAVVQQGREAAFVGCSTGGPAALRKLLEVLPDDLSRPILVVQHMPLGFTEALAARLDALTAFPVREARDGDLLEGGRVLIAPSGLQVHIDETGGRRVVRLDRDPPDTAHVPSIDVAMSSAARTLGPSAMGVLLTGMGTDGAEGLLALRRAGAYTLAEAESSAVVWGMPRMAIEMGAAVEIASLEDIARRVAELLRPLG